MINLNLFRAFHYLNIDLMHKNKVTAAKKSDSDKDDGEGNDEVEMR